MEPFPWLTEASYRILTIIIHWRLSPYPRLTRDNSSLCILSHPGLQVPSRPSVRLRRSDDGMQRSTSSPSTPPSPSRAKHTTARSVWTDAPISRIPSPSYKSSCRRAIVFPGTHTSPLSSTIPSKMMERRTTRSPMHSGTGLQLR